MRPNTRERHSNPQEVAFHQHRGSADASAHRARLTVLGYSNARGAETGLTSETGPGAHPAVYLSN
jgi:hypothetical protein